MLKKMFLTTALVSLSMGSAFAHEAAKGFDVKINAEFDAQAGARSQSKTNTADQNITTNNKQVAFDTTSYLAVRGQNTTANGTTYGANLGVTGTVTSAKQQGSKYFDRSFLFVENKSMGRFEAGTNQGASDTMMVSAASVASATGGISGDWWKYVVLTPTPGSGGVDQANFILTPAMPIDNNSSLLVRQNGTIINGNATSTNRELSRKITYYTPKFSGFQFGVSYIPDATNVGGAPMANYAAGTTGGSTKNAWSVGASWDHKFHQDHGVKLSLVGDFAKAAADFNTNTTPATTVNLRNTKVYSAGAMYQYKDMLSFAVSYTDYTKSQMPSAASEKGSNAYTAGVGLTMDKWSTSLTGMQSKKNDNKADVVSLGADYKVAPGFMPYAEVTYFKLTQKHTTGLSNTNSAFGYTYSNTISDAPGTNKGTVFILGTKIKF